jgi:phage head maturation protease
MELGKKQTPQANQSLFYRSFELDRAGLNEEKREITLSFSSEEPVERWFGSEVLLHGKKNVDLTRLNTMGAGLFNHNPNVIIGPIDRAWLSSKRGKAILRFDEDEDGSKAMSKVKSGSLRGVSVGYAINKFRRVEEGEEFQGFKGPAYIATRWTPYEITLTPIPADASVGVGRDCTRSLDGIEIETAIQDTEEQNMDEERVKKLIAEAIQGIEIPRAEDIVAAVRQGLAEEAKPQMRISTETFIDLLGRAGAVSIECKAEVSDMATAGKTEAEILRYITDTATEQPDAGDTGDLSNGTGIKSRTQQVSSFSSFEQVDDETFARGLSSPQLFLQ